MAINVKLEKFEGPLDLLLSLIAKHKLNICDIEISKLLDKLAVSVIEIEGIRTTNTRLLQLVRDKTTPRNRDE